MRKEAFAEVFGNISEEYVTEARKPRGGKKRLVLSWGAAAACLCFAIWAALPFWQSGLPAADTEPYQALSGDCAAAYEPYGALFPRTILAGYVLEGDTVGLYDEAVMKAVFCGSSAEDTMTITISEKAYFGTVLLNTVLENEPSGSRIYLSSGEYAVCYSFSTRDIRCIQGFDEMVCSAAAFGKAETN